MVAALRIQAAGHADAVWGTEQLRKEVDYGSYFETDDVRPVAARCDNEFVYVTLADERTISVPLWWYPFLLNAKTEDRAQVELTHVGVWWTVMDEGISVKSMLLGWKMPRVAKPERSTNER